MLQFLVDGQLVLGRKNAALFMERRLGLLVPELRKALRIYLVEGRLLLVRMLRKLLDELLLRGEKTPR